MVLGTCARLGLGAFLAGALVACGARSSLDVSGYAVGEEGGACSANGRCRPGLVCREGTCVEAGGDGTSPAQSCASGGPGLTDCGDGSESCCASLPVAAGTFFRTYTKSDAVTYYADADPATVSAFRLDEYEVTVGRFRRFVHAARAGWRPAAGSGKHAHLNGGRGLTSPDMVPTPGYEPGWIAADDAFVAPTDENLACDAPYATWTPDVGGHEKLPIDCVNWYEAYAFCIWDGGFLPSEAEWEYAAAGGSEQREWPWGATPPGTSNRYAIYDCDYPDGSGHCSGVANLAPVGTADWGAGRFGQLDLAGNVIEWSVDYYDHGSLGLGHLFAGGACLDCAYVAPWSEVDTPGPDRVARGGDFHDGFHYLLPPMPDLADEASRSRGVGFRCARAP